jgi:hypothetical protein
MIRKLFLIIGVAVISNSLLFSQVKPKFTGDPGKFKEELSAFLGPNLTPDQTLAVNAFYVKWDSAGFTSENMKKIVDISSGLASRNLRINPHFIDFLKALTSLSGYTTTKDYINYWLKGLAEMIKKTKIPNDNLDRLFKNTSSFIKDKIICESGNIRWKVAGNNIGFKYDTIFSIILKDAALIAYSGKDSTEINKVNGEYFPEITEFRGSSGIVYWEKAGYGKSDAYTEITKYTINTLKAGFTVDTARMTHKTYFPEPVYGKMSDQATFYSSPEKALFPKFETFENKFIIKNMYEGVDYEGGLALEGASVKGTGDVFSPARFKFYKNDTLYLKVISLSYLLTKSTITTQNASAALYLGKDSIYHSSIGFSYTTQNRQISLFKTNNPVSKSPFYDSFHGMDMYFESLYWNMNESKITLSRPRGASIGQARFESVSFFTSSSFDRLMGIDDYHPLYRIREFAKWFYSDTFPVEEFAKWLKKPLEAVIGLCIDLANRGFLFYNRSNNEVTIKKKLDDYIAANGKKKDYDVMSIFSETNAPTDNASLDLRNFKLSVNGVQRVFLSDSQKVAIYPYKSQLTIGKNRSLNFDGVVEAGLFTIFGHNFTFDYDTFKIRLQSIDSIIIAVETNKRDNMGNFIISEIDNIIQLTKAELYIDDPKNKSGLRSLQQYPIINATAFSYIFFDRIPGIEGKYPQADFYFKIDPFTYENIDHYQNEDMSLAGEFYGGNIIKPTRQFLTIQEDNSLGFSMNIPESGIPVYEGKGTMFNSLSLSNKGLMGSGTLKRLTSVTESDDYRFFPDSMITKAATFTISRDPEGLFPDLKSRDVSVKWLTRTDEWLASNTKGINFELFGNGTVLDGSLNLTQLGLKGKGTVDMSDSRIVADAFRFASSTIQADTSVYNLKSPKTDGYAFIAENVNTTIDFNIQQSKFSLNSGNSVVKFPDLQYISTMSDFWYDMKTKILSMEQKGRTSATLSPPDQLLKTDLKNLDRPTFFATNSLKDTISFSSLKGRYSLQNEYIEAEDINYIHIADALIQPDSGKIIITRGAKIQPLRNAILAVNNKHILHSANISIENTSRYSGSALYDYIDEDNGIQQINFPEITVDTATTTAKGYIPVTQKFMLSPAFSFTGDVALSARSANLAFTGSAGIIQNCSGLKSYNIKFKSEINRSMVMIPVSEKPRDMNDNLVFFGSFINMDSTHIYPAFMSEKKSYADVQLVNATGMLFYEKQTGKYKLGPIEKLSDPTLPGGLITYDKNFCIISGEGKMDLGADFDLVKMASAGKVVHSLDSGKVSIETLLALDFYFSDEALRMMSDEIRMMPTLTAVNLNSDLYKKGMKDLLGESTANQINEEMGLFGTARSLPKQYTYKLLLNDVKFYWNEATASFRSQGKIGIGFIGQQAVNVYVDGNIEIQRRRSGDMIDIYLKADNSTWYYFSYFKGVMMTQSGNSNYNALITNAKVKDRKDPASSVRVPYTYMIAVEDRLNKFLRRISSENAEDQEQ